MQSRSPRLSRPAQSAITAPRTNESRTILDEPGRPNPFREEQGRADGDARAWILAAASSGVRVSEADSRQPEVYRAQLNGAHRDRDADARSTARGRQPARTGRGRVHLRREFPQRLLLEEVDARGFA